MANNTSDRRGRWESDYSLAEYMTERDRLERRMAELKAALREIITAYPNPDAVAHKIARGALDREQETG